MRTPDGSIVTAHSLNPVPFLLAGAAVEGRRLADGVLADVAPTLVDVAGLAPVGRDDAADRSCAAEPAARLPATIPRSPRRIPLP